MPTKSIQSFFPKQDKPKASPLIDPSTPDPLPVASVEELQADLDKTPTSIESLISGLPDGHEWSKLQIKHVFSSHSNVEDAVFVGEKLLSDSLVRIDLHLEPFIVLDEEAPYDTSRIAEECFLADNGQPLKDTFPLQNMAPDQSRAFLIIGGNRCPWLLADVVLGARLDAFTDKRQCTITVHGRNEPDRNAIRYLLMLLTLAKKRRNSPLRAVDFVFEGVKQVAIEQGSDLGLLGVVTTGILLSRYDDVASGYSDDIRTSISVRLACAEQIKQLVFRATGHPWSRQTLTQRLKPNLRTGGSQGQKRSIGLLEANKTSLAVVPVKATKKTRWSQVDTDKLLKMREDEGKSFEDMATILDRTAEAVTRKFYNLRPQGQVHQKRRKLDPSVEGNEEGYTLPLEVLGSVPCSNQTRGCDFVAPTYREILWHVNKKCTHKDDVGPFPCAWDPENCPPQFSMVGKANHYKTHNRILTEGDFPCRRGCGVRWPDPYLLTTHEISCTFDKRPKGDQRTAQVVTISLAPEAETLPPSIVFVARESSNKAPQAWVAGKGSMVEGLPIWAEPRVEAYRRLYQDHRPAVLVAGLNVKTRLTPTPARAMDIFEAADSSTQKSNKTRAMEFTKAIVDVLQNAPDRPVLVSIGSDGFSCSTTRLFPFLERVPAFDMVLRLTFIEHAREEHGPKLTESSLVKDLNVTCLCAQRPGSLNAPLPQQHHILNA